MPASVSSPVMTGARTGSDRSGRRKAAPRGRRGRPSAEGCSPTPPRPRPCGALRRRTYAGGTGGRHRSSVPAMKRLLLALIIALTGPAVAVAEVPCPVPTDDPARYQGADAPFRCHSAITDPNGLVVVLREGRPAAAGPGPFGRQHAAIDRGVSDAVIARVVSTVQPLPGQQRRLHYVEQGAVEIWVVVDRASSRQAPDTRPFGVITAFCRKAGGAPERCPPWVSSAGQRDFGTTQ